VNIPASLYPQLIINALLVAGTLWYLPRAVRGRKNRAVTVVLLVMALYGLWLNLRGYSISGWQNGFSTSRA
jgi:hypothetical protein